MKEIDKIKAYCVINEVTMQQVSQFYRRKGDAERWIAIQDSMWKVHVYAVAEFSFDKCYGVE